MEIKFVHTPMASVPVPERELFWKNFDLKYIEAHPNYKIMETNLWELPHWMLWLAGVLREHGYTKTGVIDFYSNYEGALKGMDLVQVQEVLKHNEADVYLFSPMTANLHFALEIAGVIKLLYPRSRVVFGGVISTPLHHEIINNPGIDYIVVDRGEEALPALLDCIKNRTSPEEVGNLTYKNSDGKVIYNKKRYQFPDVTKLEFPKVDLFPGEAGKGLRYIRHVHALGCPFQCSFCTIQTIGRRPTYFPLDRVLAEIRAYKKHYGNHHHIYWGDETFTAYRKRTLELCSALKSEGGIEYDCQTRLNCITKVDLMDALVESGCRWIEIGIETANQESQNLFKQRLRLADIENTFAKMRDRGLHVCTFMLNGFPNQTLDDMKESIDWICSMLEKDLVRASYFSNIVPFPGSPFFHAPGKMGIKLHHRDFKYYNEDLAPVFDSQYATSDEVQEVFLKGMTQIAEATAHNSSLQNDSRLNQIGSFWQGAHP